MRGLNLSQWAVEHRLCAVLIVAIAAAGVYSY